MEFGYAFAGKAVLAAAVCALNGVGATASPSLVKLVEAKMPSERPACITCEFAETSCKLQIYLSLVARDHRAEASVPNEEYAMDLYKKYNTAKDFAIAFWRQFEVDNPAIFARIKAGRPDLDWVLRVDPDSPTTLFFDPDCVFRAGIFCLPVDSQGRPLVKRQ